MDKQDMEPAKNEVQGEGDYDAAREYNERTRRFVESGRVDEAAQQAEPSDPEEAAELEDAEQVGKSHAKGSAPSGEHNPDDRSDG
jgi:hypothetical protein